MNKKKKHKKREFSETDVLNKLEKKALKGKATDRELRLLAEGYQAFNVPMPKKIWEMLR